MEVAKNRNNISWTSSSGKGSLLDSNSKQRSGGVGLESPLATQLQQAWLQTQLPKRNVPKLDFLSPLPSPDYLVRSSPDPFAQPQLQFVPAASRSPSYSQHSPSYSQSSPRYSPDTFSDAYSSHSDGAYSSHSDGGSAVSPVGQEEAGVESDPMEDDTMIQYLSDMLMEDQLTDQKCMYVQCSAYQAMTKELADLIEDRSPPQEQYGDSYGAPTSYEEPDKDVAVNSWIDEVLNSDPQDFHVEHVSESPGFSDIQDEVSSIASGITNITTGSPRSYDSAQKSFVPASVPVVVEERGSDLIKVYECLYVESGRPSRKIDYMDGRSGIESLVDLYPLLMQCAQAVASDDVREAHQLINHLRPKVSSFGDGGQRMSYFVVEALVARLSGTGAQLYTALTSNRPSAVEMLKAYRMFVEANPLPRVSHFFANATIMKAVEKSDRIHIVDYGILYGVQWPCLLKKLSLREGGPPFVRITGIDFAQPGFQKNTRLEETGRRLAAMAKEVGVEFEYHAIAGKWENITAAQLALRDDETLVVNSMFRLRNLLDETVMASSPRKMVLAKIRSLNPKVFVMGIISAGYNSPFFMARFRETINHFSAVFDAIHSSCPPDVELRRLAEKEILGREMLNIIACEGTERIERAETYRQWQSRTLNAGFKQLPIDASITERTPELLKNFNRNYGFAVEGNWLLNGWKDRVIHALTAWAPA